jgi:ribonuclease BN (tRNA processing enzyme)
VLVSHGHPDHCADLNPLLRARALGDNPPKALPIHALPGATDAVLALDRPGMLDDAYVPHDIEAGRSFSLGPFAIETRSLPHSRPNVGFRLSADGVALVYTGDAGPDPALVELARGADLLLAESTYVDVVPRDNLGTLSSAWDAGHQAAEAGVGGLVLTHLPPGTNRAWARRAAERAAGASVVEGSPVGSFAGPILVARPGLELTVGGTFRADQDGD